MWLHYSPKGAATTPSSQNFDYLGFIALSDNSSTNFQSRELQSVTVTPRIGTHIKLRFGSPYGNKYNDHGQLALIAVNILGTELTQQDLKSSLPSSSGSNAQQSMSDADNAISSICDDLSFSMYVEESVAEVIREMETKKSKAVGDERFEYARKLKLCMNVLRQAGERLGRYSLAKRQAVHHEDFTTARLRKEQIEIYRTSVFEQLLAEQLLEKDGEQNPENDNCSELYASKPSLPSPPSLQDVASSLSGETSGTPTPGAVKQLMSKPSDCESTPSPSDNQSQPVATAPAAKPVVPSSPNLNQLGRSPSRGSPSMGSLRRRNKSAPRNSYEDYDERCVPALRQ